MSMQTLGSRYQILQHLGGGGFGQTFLAVDLHLPGHPCCVVKRLQPRKTDAANLEAARRLFDAEAAALYVLGVHDQIPRLLAHFEENQQFYLAQEFVEGPLLKQEIQTGVQISESATIAVIEDILTTLCVVHGHQVIHRDIKPANLIRRQRDGKIVLIDFGAVKQISCQSIQSPESENVTVAVGSLGYMPNEQLAGHPCFSSDVYAVGILAIQALTGLDPQRIPKESRTGELMWQDAVMVKPQLAKVIDQMVRYDYRERFPTAQEALKALKQAIAADTCTIVTSDLQDDGGPAYRAWLERADDLFEQNRFLEAARVYQKVVQINPQAITAWFKLGIALENTHQHTLAVAAYQQVTQQNAQDYLAWLKLGKALERLGDYPQALIAYDEVLTLQPKNYWAWAERGQLFEAMGQTDEALAAYHRAIELKPDFQLALDSRKRLLITLKQVDQLYTLQHYDAAIQACDEMLKEHPDDATVWLMRGMALENQKQLAEAAIAYNTVISLQPEDHMAWFRLGTVLEDLGYLQRAAKAYSNVTRLQPRNHWAWYQLGRVLQELERYQEAISAFQRAARIQPLFEPAQTAYQHLLKRALTRHTAMLPALSQSQG